MDLVLFGIQGSGKGTQSKIIAEKCELEIFETGGALRKLSAEDSELGRKVKSTIEAGHLVTTEIVMEIIEDFLKKLPAGKSALFDGIPRSEDQKIQFDQVMKNTGRNFMGLWIELTSDEAMKRLTTRRVCSKCKEGYPAFYQGEKCEKGGGELITRTDDTPDAIKVRLQTFDEKTLPVIHEYETEGKMLKVDGEKSIPDVTSDILSILKPYYADKL